MRSTAGWILNREARQARPNLDAELGRDEAPTNLRCCAPPLTVPKDRIRRHLVEDHPARTGLVGASGGLGGFFPPLVLGVIKETTGSFVPGFILLGLFAVFCFVVLVAVEGGRDAAGWVAGARVAPLSRRHGKCSVSTHFRHASSKSAKGCGAMACWNAVRPVRSSAWVARRFL